VTNTEQQSIFIIGAGQAGCEVALGLRQQGCVAPIVLVGDEAHPPYQRPPLSSSRTMR
jgi:3-phenylpropionate/trans-cinnamate dioxygenase ferredoxin reductase component